MSVLVPGLAIAQPSLGRMMTGAVPGVHPLEPLAGNWIGIRLAASRSGWNIGGGRPAKTSKTSDGRKCRDVALASLNRPVS